jgi:hypothetical protein
VFPRTIFFLLLLSPLRKRKEGRKTASIPFSNIEGRRMCINGLMLFKTKRKRNPNNILDFYVTMQDNTDCHGKESETLARQ